MTDDPLSIFRGLYEQGRAAEREAMGLVEDEPLPKAWCRRCGRCCDPEELMNSRGLCEECLVNYDADDEQRTQEEIKWPRLGEEVES